MITSNTGSTAIFHNGYKYLKSGSSKSSVQYRCCNYLKKCRSRIVFKRENETSLKNEVPHNHENDFSHYLEFLESSIQVRHFGRANKV
jgi:FLYWCH zinc finger domain